MAFEVKFYSFAKKLNSTKRPAGTPRTYQCEVKTGCSAITPIIIIAGSNKEIEDNYNYCYISNWNRYYFITDYYYDRGRWFITLDCDVLATWKPYIGGSSNFVLRSASNRNSNIADDKIIPRFYNTTQSVKRVSWFDNINGGTYVLGVKGVISAGNINGGAVTYYVLPQQALIHLVRSLCDSDNSIYTDLNKEQLKTIYDPMQFIVSCRWFPFAVGRKAGNIKEVPLGWYTIAFTDADNVGLADVYTYLYENRIEIPFNSNNRYIRSSAFSTYNIYLPAYGVYELSGDFIADTDPEIENPALDISLTVDTATGQGVYVIYRHSTIVLDTPIAVINCNVAVDIPMVATSISTCLTESTGVGSLNEAKRLAVQSVAMPATAFAVSENRDVTNFIEDNIVTDNPKFHNRVAGKTLEAAANVTTLALYAASPVTKNVNMVGGSGNRTQYSDLGDILIYTYTTGYELPPYDIVGYPTMKKLQISTLSGYILCSNAQCEAPATSVELAKIISFMNGGFFYE